MILRGTRFSLLGRWGESPPLAENLLIPSPPGKIHPNRFSPSDSYLTHQRFTPPLNNNFHVITNKNFIFSCRDCSCIIFILTLYSLYTHVMLILILINVPYLQNAVFSFEKGLNDQNHSFTPAQIPTIREEYSPSKFSHSHWGEFLYPLLQSRKPWGIEVDYFAETPLMLKTKLRDDIQS